MEKSVCMAYKMVEWNGKTGIIMPFYDKGSSFLQDHLKVKKKRENGLLPLNCVTNFCLLTKKEIG